MAHHQFETSINEFFNNIEEPPTRGPIPRCQRQVSIADPKSPCSPSLQKKSLLGMFFRTPVRTPSRKQLLSKTPLRTPSKTPSKATPKKKGKTPNKDVPKNQGDRFIPNRSQCEFDLGHYKIMQGEEENEEDEDSENYKSALADSLNIPHVQKEAKILSFKQRAPQAEEGFYNRNKVLYSSSKSNLPKGKSKRFIPQKSDRILDAPELIDDFYLTLIDWGSQNLLATALNSEVFLYNANSSEIEKLTQMKEAEEYICSVSWIAEGNILAVGNSLGQVQLWDVETGRCLRAMGGHASRVGVLSWNSHILTSGSQSGKIHHHDVRIPDHHVATLNNHEQAVCGLEWSPDGSYLASGGNDNVLNIWEESASTGSEPLYSISHHQAAVKAISWCPWQSHLLASGGGAADRTIRLWAANTGMCLKTVDTESQVSGILWSSEHREIASGHGYSQNQITLWKYPNMDKIAHLQGHTSRILNMAISPDKTTIVTAGADETLRFWNCFAHNPKKKKQMQMATKKLSTSSLSTRTIR